jgi:hypothetical protein
MLACEQSIKSGVVCTSVMAVRISLSGFTVAAHAKDICSLTLGSLRNVLNSLVLFDVVAISVLMANPLSI